MAAFLGCQFLGCQVNDAPQVFNKTPNLRVYQRAVQPSIRRIVVLPIQSRRNHWEFANQLRQEVSQQLSAFSGIEIIELSQNDLVWCQQNLVTRGSLDERFLARMHREYRADAVLFSNLEVRRAYAPQSADLSCYLIHTHESVVANSVSGTWDLKRPSDQARFQCYIQNLSLDMDAQTWAQDSPRIFAGFVARDTTHGLLNPGNGQPN